MSIKGSLQTTKTNDFGFTAIKVGGSWYGADKKNFKPDANEGDIVEFEPFKNPKGYDTYRSQSFKKIVSAPEAPSSVGSGSPSNARAQPSVSNGGRDSYWADKATEDAKKDPRIVYQSSYERAILFVDLAIKNGAFEALNKAKPTAKLEILTAFVDEQAERIMGNVYASVVPSVDSQLTSAPSKKGAGVSTAAPAELESDLPEVDEGTWV